MNRTIPLRGRVTVNAAIAAFIHCGEHVEAAALCQEICIVDRRANRNCFGGTTEHVAEVVSEAVQFVRLEANVVLDDNIVC